jgi:hypothetical protein
VYSLRSERIKRMSASGVKLPPRNEHKFGWFILKVFRRASITLGRCSCCKAICVHVCMYACMYVCHRIKTRTGAQQVSAYCTLYSLLVCALHSEHTVRYSNLSAYLCVFYKLDSRRIQTIDMCAYNASEERISTQRNKHACM